MCEHLILNSNYSSTWGNFLAERKHAYKKTMYPFGGDQIPDICDEVAVEIRRRNKLSGGATKSVGGDEPGTSLSCSE
jgi:hypothetical protein